MMYSNVVNWFVVAVSLLAATAVVHGEEEQRMNGGDIVQSRKALLLRSRERLLSKARQHHNQYQQHRMSDAEHPERDLQTMVCGVCTSGSSQLNKTLLEEVNEYIRTGEANTTEILYSMLKTIDASYSKNKKDMEKQYGLNDNDSSPDYISTAIMTTFALSQQKLKKTLVKFSNDVESNQDGGIFELINTITGIIELILSAVIAIFCLLIPDSDIVNLLLILTDLLFYVTTIIEAIAAILELFGQSLLNSSSGRRMLASGEDNDDDDDTRLFPVDALFPGIPCEIDTLLCQINTMKNDILSSSSGNNKSKKNKDP